MSDPKHRTEQVYDDEMAPLVAQLIAIATRESIPLFVSAGMLCLADHHGNEDTKPMPTTCTTLISLESTDPLLRGMINRHGLAFGVVRGHSGFDIAAALVIGRYHPEKRDV